MTILAIAAKPHLDMNNKAVRLYTQLRGIDNLSGVEIETLSAIPALEKRERKQYTKDLQRIKKALDDGRQKEKASASIGSLNKLERIIANIPIGWGTPEDGDDVVDEWADKYESVVGKKAQKLGTGFFSAVYIHPTNPNKVIKVLHQEDTCWVKYAKIASGVRGKQARYVPKIYAGSVDSDGNGIYITERLVPWSLKYAQDSYKEDPYPWLYMNHHNLSIAGVPYSKTDKAAFKVDRRHPFTKLFDTIYKSCDMDIHTGNIMFRRDGSFVLSDPVIGDDM